MKRVFIVLAVCLATLSAVAQNRGTMPTNTVQATNDSATFTGHLYNKEYNVYIQMDFYHNNVMVPHQEVFGEMPGYFGDNQDARKWLFTDAEITSPTSAIISIINDYGSEDLTASLTKKNHNVYILKQLDGSTIKIARNHKWVKLPKVLEFFKK